MKKEDVFAVLPRLEEEAIEVMETEGSSYDTWLNKQTELMAVVRNYRVNNGL